MTAKVANYLRDALDFIQQHSVIRERVDWEAVRQEVLTLAQPAQTTEETYPAIRLALKRLGDHHSFLIDPQSARQQKEGRVHNLGLLVVFPDKVIVRVSPNSPAAEAGVRVGDSIEMINGQSVNTLDVKMCRSALQAPTVHLQLSREEQNVPLSVMIQAKPYKVENIPWAQRLDSDIGYIDLPAVQGNQAILNQYATTAQRLIREIDQAITHGWIVDLRRNTGGNMWGMLAGIGPVLGEGISGSFMFPDGKQTSWTYSKGQAFTFKKRVSAQVKKAYQLQQTLPSVAVLTSRLTCSSGEFMAISFRGRPKTRSFGEPTAGLPTANSLQRLSDGAELYLTTALGADRTGQSYNGPLVPNVMVQANWKQLGTKNDSVLQAAYEWLKSQQS